MTNLVKLLKQMIKDNPSLKPTSEYNSKEYAKISFGLMVQKGLTQSQLASLINVPDSDIHRLQGGSKYMGDEFYNKVFTALGVTMKEVDEYLEELEEMDNDI